MLRRLTMKSIKLSKPELPSELSARVMTLTLLALIAWFLAGFLVYGVLKAEDRLTKLSEGSLTLLGIVFVLLFTFSINRTGQEHDFFCQKQIEEVMAQANQLGHVAIAASLPEDSRKEYLRTFALTNRSRFFLVYLWAKQKFPEPEQPYNCWREIAESLNFSIVPKKINEFGLNEAMAGLNRLLDTNHWEEADKLASVMLEQIHTSLENEFKKVL